jgi:hypothetical protein
MRTVLVMVLLATMRVTASGELFHRMLERGKVELPFPSF